MPLEIERKFLLVPGELPPTTATEPIEQGYLAVTEEGVEVRLRRIAGQCVLGVKHGHGGLSRTEVECPLTDAEFEELWPATAGRRLVKTRYSVPVRDLVASVDVYAHELAGLRTVEVEFATEDAARAFTPPDWFGAEITGVREYKNRLLAVEGLPEVLH
ncbi:CYTH domain-containing protein [Streptomyces similanensis]|uniref:CYTH domain-containing protein n=1 Tax=Streptomyces similanensis TaxID=1274988 RepID=A0ABP9JUI3_9ACTN|nr:adenylate cyclase [Streptomyces seoulensis]